MLAPQSQRVSHLNCNFTPTFSKIEGGEERFHTHTVKNAAGIDQNSMQTRLRSQETRRLLFLHDDTHSYLCMCLLKDQHWWHLFRTVVTAQEGDEEPEAWSLKTPQIVAEQLGTMRAFTLSETMFGRVKEKSFPSSVGV